MAVRRSPHFARVPDTGTIHSGEPVRWRAADAAETERNFLFG
jgi:hypothetical protein